MASFRISTHDRITADLLRGTDAPPSSPARVSVTLQTLQNGRNTGTLRNGETAVLHFLGSFTLFALNVAWQAKPKH